MTRPKAVSVSPYVRSAPRKPDAYEIIHAQFRNEVEEDRIHRECLAALEEDLARDGFFAHGGLT